MSFRFFFRTSSSPHPPQTLACLQVPFSNHSNFEELVAFVHALRPRKVINMMRQPADHLFQAHGPHPFLVQAQVQRAGAALVATAWGSIDCASARARAPARARAGRRRQRRNSCPRFRATLYAPQ